MIPHLEPWLHMEQSRGGMLVELLALSLPARSIGQWRLSRDASVIPIVRDISALAIEPFSEEFIGYAVVVFAPVEQQASPLGLAYIRDDFLACATDTLFESIEPGMISGIRTMALASLATRYQAAELERVTRKAS